MAVIVSSILIGTLLGAEAERRIAESPLGRWHDEHLLTEDRWREPVVFEGRLREDATPTPYGARLNVAVERVILDRTAVQMAGGLRANVGGMLVADRMHSWRRGRSVQFPATVHRPAAYLNPGASDQAHQLAVRGTELIGSVKSAILVETIGRGHLASETSARIRAYVRETIGQYVGGYSVRSAGIVTAILIGDRAGLQRETERRLQDAGTFHVIAISGGNIAILAAFVLKTMRLVRVSRRIAAWFVVVLLTIYAYIVGHEASVVRATAVAAVFLTAYGADHRTPPPNALGVAAVVIVTADPLAIYDAGFILTFGATLALLLWAPSLTRRWTDRLSAATGCSGAWIQMPLALLAATCCVELALLPVGAHLFARVTFAGLLLNFLAVPLMTMAQLSGLAVVAVAALSPTLSVAAGAIAHLAAGGLLESTRLLDLMPWLALRVAPPSVGLLLAYYAGLLLWTVPSNSTPFVLSFSKARTVLGTGVFRSKGLGVLLVAGSTCGMLAGPVNRTELGRWLGVHPTAPHVGTVMRSEGRLRVIVLDVGQGDASFVRFPDGKTLLIDTGGTLAGDFDIGERVVAPALWAEGVRVLDYLALTHGDPDHVGAAVTVLRDFRPREVWEGVPVPAAEALSAIAAEARRQRSAWRRLQAGDRLSLGGADLIVWHPPPPDWERQRVRNDDSLVIELRYGAASVVFPGDIGAEVERALAARIPPAPLRVLKTPHHGSATSSSVELLSALRPQVAIVSAGRQNVFGHPAPPVVARYHEAGAVIFHTGQHGAITVDTDGRTMTIKTMTGQRVVFPRTTTLTK
jgi:competence protein ComEC